VQDVFFAEWRASQAHFLEELEAYFNPVPLRRVPLLPHEILGTERIRDFARLLYPEDVDPSAVTRTERPYEFHKVGDHYEVRLHLPFTEKAEVGLFKKGDELVVEIGTLRRHIGLPTSMVSLQPVRARLESRMLVVEMREAV